jgi:AraC-like DNA-binding protein
VQQLSISDFNSVNECCFEAEKYAKPAKQQKLLEQLFCHVWDIALMHHNRLYNQTSLAEKAASLVLKHPDVTVDELALMLDISASYLTRKMKSDLGCSFVEHKAKMKLVSFLIHARFKKMNLLDSALASGFGSYVQCYRVFNKLTGWSPQKYLFNDGRNTVASIKE